MFNCTNEIKMVRTAEFLTENLPPKFNFYSFMPWKVLNYLDPNEGLNTWSTLSLISVTKKKCHQAEMQAENK